MIGSGWDGWPRGEPERDHTPQTQPGRNRRAYIRRRQREGLPPPGEPRKQPPPLIGGPSR